MPRQGRTTSGVLGAAALAVVVLGGCSAGGSNATSAGSAVDAGGGRSAALRAAPGAAPVGTRGAADANVQTRAVVRTGEIALTGRDLTRIRRQIDGLLAALGGTVDDEDSRNGRHGRIVRSTLVLRVPAARFQAAEDALERLGTVRSATESAEDVTTKVIDTDQRVRTLRNSLDRLHHFQRRATDVGDLLRYEREITARQAELQSHVAQQRYLSDQTAMATITVHLSTPATYVPPPGPLEHAGFVAGLRGGWNALVAAAVVVVTVLGAVLPFGLVLGLLGVPSWLALRAWSRRRRADAAAEQSP